MLIDIFDSLQQGGLQACVKSRADKSLDVFGEAGAAVAHSGVDELIADAAV